MVTARTATGLRLTCKVVGPRNHLGNERLFATLLDEGIQVWCKHCCEAHLIPKEACILAWEQGILATTGCGHPS